MLFGEFADPLFPEIAKAVVGFGKAVAQLARSDVTDGLRGADEVGRDARAGDGIRYGLHWKSHQNQDQDDADDEGFQGAESEAQETVEPAQAGPFEELLQQFPDHRAEDLDDDEDEHEAQHVGHRAGG